MTKTHIILAFVAILAGACASRENQSQSSFNQEQREQVEYTHNTFDASARFR